MIIVIIMAVIRIQWILVNPTQFEFKEYSGLTSVAD